MTSPESVISRLENQLAHLKGQLEGAWARIMAHEEEIADLKVELKRQRFSDGKLP